MLTIENFYPAHLRMNDVIFPAFLGRPFPFPFPFALGSGSRRRLVFLVLPSQHLIARVGASALSVLEKKDRIPDGGLGGRASACAARAASLAALPMPLLLFWQPCWWRPPAVETLPLDMLPLLLLLLLLLAVAAAVAVAVAAVAAAAAVVVAALLA